MALFHGLDRAALTWVFVTTRRDLRFLQLDLDSLDLCNIGKNNTYIYVNASAVHSILLYKYALHSQHGETKPSASRKQSSGLLDDGRILVCE